MYFVEAKVWRFQEYLRELMMSWDLNMEIYKTEEERREESGFQINSGYHTGIMTP